MKIVAQARTAAIKAAFLDQFKGGSASDVAEQAVRRNPA
jgi:hypothetical protein